MTYGDFMTAKEALKRVRSRIQRRIRGAEKLAREARTPGSRGQYESFASFYRDALYDIKQVEAEIR